MTLLLKLLKDFVYKLLLKVMDILKPLIHQEQQSS